MKAYKRWIVVKDPGKVVLSDLPFHPGERVEAIFVSEDEEQDTQPGKILFAETQQLPHIHAISEDEIAAEIAAYRTGK